MRRLGKRLAVSALCACMMLGVAGCGGSDNGKKADSKSTEIEQVYTADEAKNTKALVIGDYDIDLDELTLYAMQEITMYGVTSDSLTDDKTIEQNKEYALSLLRQNKIIYNVAINNDASLDDSDMEYINTTIDAFKKKMGQKVLDAYGISDEVINKVFQEQGLVSKFQNDIKNDMGQKIQNDLEDKYKDTKFYTYYYMLFPTVEIDDSGNPKKDENDNYIYVSDDKKKEAKANAEAALKELKAGSGYEDVADKYGVKEYSSEQTGFDGAYSDENMNKKMASLKNNECLDVVDDTLGYSVIQMINCDDTSYKESYINYYTSDTLSSQYEKLQNTWLATIPVDQENDLEGTVWKDYDFKKLVQNLENAGVVGSPDGATSASSSAAN